MAAQDSPVAVAEVALRAPSQMLGFIWLVAVAAVRPLSATVEHLLPAREL